MSWPPTEGLRGVQNSANAQIQLRITSPIEQGSPQHI